MSLTSYESFFKYESNDIKLVWYNVQILQLSISQRLTSLNLGFWEHHTKRKGGNDIYLFIMLIRL